MSDGILKPAEISEISERRTEYIKRLPKEIGFVADNLLTEENLKNALFYPAAGDDFKPVERFSKETDIFIYVDTGLKAFTDLFSGREKSELNIVKSHLATLMHIVQVHDIPKTKKIDKLIKSKFKKYKFSDGRFRTEPDRTPVGIFQIATSNGPKLLFYIVNEGYWTYLHLFHMGKMAPKILYMKTDFPVAAEAGDMLRFEDEKGIKVLFKAKPKNIYCSGDRILEH